jgi:glycosyltransferase involved in cell wall biosynthesis
MKLSVIICTHNPRLEYLSRTLEALRLQTLLKAEWELLVIDNASRPPAGGLVSLKWHPYARHIREEVLGLTPARLRGIQEAQGQLLVFVDGDNLLDQDYLTNAVEIYEDYPFLGAFGGSIDGEFEVNPPLSITPYLEGLALRRIVSDHWSNAKKWSEATPFGAGMCVRCEVAELYLKRVRNDGIRLALDRQGTSLGAGGDTDIAWTSFSLDKGTGCFARLRLTHLISKDRLTESYIERLYTGLAYADEILAFEYTGSSDNYNGTMWNTVRYWCRYIRSSPFGRKIMKAKRSGQKAAQETLLRGSSSSFRNPKLTLFASEAGDRAAIDHQ